ncbi:MAG: citramalate synthase [Candidatus Marinimicrobia bacterium]|nr:citramalate synthase [Candidatus Neomarinimicrobiota bacterium]
MSGPTRRRRRTSSPPRWTNLLRKPYNIVVGTGTVKIELFDTTLRDGTQGQGVNLSVADKLHIAQALDEFGIDIIEGGWPGSNPRDQEFFDEVGNLQLKHARICAFGSTARKPGTAATDANLDAIVRSETPVVSLFGKCWRFHSRKGLRLTDEENEAIIYESVAFLKGHGREVIFDAEHFFDGYKDDPAFALTMIKAAQEAGADTIALCDTNGGSLPNQIKSIIEKIKAGIKTSLGIHAHNDSELAVANTLMAVEAGATHVQGTMNGVGERCGNANLCSVIPGLLLKMGHKAVQELDLRQLTTLSHFISEVMNMAPNPSAAYVGKSAFAHKGGIHVSAVMRDAAMYEHTPPETVGATRHVLVSDLSGQSNIRYKAEELGIDLSGHNGKNTARDVVQEVKSLEHQGYQFDGAEASFELLLRRQTGEFQPFFEVLESSAKVHYDNQGRNTSEAVLKVQVGDEVEHTAADGVGPVNALDNALRKALVRFYPEIADVRLIDYKVRVLNEKRGTSARVRVLIESSDGQTSWSTVGVSENIIQASWQAINDSLNFKLYKHSQTLSDGAQSRKDSREKGAPAGKTSASKS